MPAYLRRIIWFAGILMMPCFSFAQAPQCPALLLAIEVDGTVSAGSKDELRKMVNQGRSLRVGWRVDDREGNPVVTHWADAAFLTLFEGDVFAQMQSIHRQVPRRGQARIELSDEVQHWTGLIGTNGLLISRMNTNDQAQERKVKSWWCLVTDQTVSKADRLECQLPGWRLLYQHDKDGSRLLGSKQWLLDTIRGGQPIRIAWGLAHPSDPGRSVEHAAEPVFITITNQVEVVAQLPEHVAQASYWNVEQAEFADPAVMWRAMLTTTGSFDAIWVNRATGEVLRRAPQRHQLAWYGQTVPLHCPKQTLQLVAPAPSDQ